jgi:hypothetical protein
LITYEIPFLRNTELIDEPVNLLQLLFPLLAELPYLSEDIQVHQSCVTGLQRALTGTPKLQLAVLQGLRTLIQGASAYPNTIRYTVALKYLQALGNNENDFYNLSNLLFFLNSS